MKTILSMITLVLITSQASANEQWTRLTGNVDNASALRESILGSVATFAHSAGVSCQVVEGEYGSFTAGRDIDKEMVRIQSGGDIFISSDRTQVRFAENLSIRTFNVHENQTHFSSYTQEQYREGRVRRGTILNPTYENVRTLVYKIECGYGR